MSESDREHTVELNTEQADKLWRWLQNPTGSLRLGRASFEAVVGGNIMVRTQPWRAS